MTNTKNSWMTAASALVLTALVGSSSALAQTSKNVDDSAGQRKKPVLDEILVTATKKSRAESMQDVPIAITALGEEQLNSMHFESITDIGHSLPNVTLDDAVFVGGQATFFMRGVGVNHTSQTMDPAVGVTINGMPLGQNLGMTTDSFDLESLEVLRGPQGTLFGRNSTGGAIVLRTKRPTGEFGFEARATAGSYDRRDIAFGIENSLAEGILSGRLAVIYKDRDGYFDNAQGGRIGEERTRIVRPTLVFTPTETLDITLFGEYGKSDYGMPAIRNIFDPETSMSNVFYTPPTNDLQDLDQNFSGPNELEWWHAIVEMNWDIGPGQLTSVTGYREQEAVVSIDIDGTSHSLAKVHFLPSAGEQHQFSQELRYALDLNDRLNLTTGLYYFDQSFRSGLATDVFGGLNIRDGYTDHKTSAVFAQGEIDLAEGWVLTLGGRYSRETKDGRYVTSAGGRCDVPPANNPTLRTGCDYDFEGSENWNNFSPKVSLQWFISDKTQAYLSWTKGFRSGGFNNEASSPTAASPFDEETVEAYELGLKTDFLDDRVRLNLAAFYNDYTDMQRFSGFVDTASQATINTVLNVGGAAIMGFEGELTWLATDRLSFTASLGLMDNDIKEFEGLDVDGDNIADPELAKDLDLVKVPDLSYSLGTAYAIPLSNGEVTLRGDYAFTDERFGTDNNNTLLDPVRLLNVSITYAVADGNYSVSAFGKNVLNDVSTLHEVKTSFYHFAQISTPATWGIEFKYNY